MILPAYDQAAAWREAGRCVIGGFHSPIESECLRILLRGRQPVVICPARSLPKIIPLEWKQALADHRLLILSVFPETDSRPTIALAERRNRFVAVHAAAVAYGFVFLHPFEDGNGRIHRFLIHNILARREFTPDGVIFPVSAAIKKAIQEIVDMPDRKIDLFIQACLQNNGRLSARKRAAHFDLLSDVEVNHMEVAVRSAYGTT